MSQNSLHAHPRPQLDRAIEHLEAISHIASSPARDLIIQRAIKDMGRGLVLLTIKGHPHISNRLEVVGNLVWSISYDNWASGERRHVAFHVNKVERVGWSPLHDMPSLEVNCVDF